MNTIEIKNRYTNKVIFSHECDNNTIKITLEKAIQLKVNLNRAQLDDAQLDDAQLDDAQLNRAQLNRAQLNRAQLNGAQLNGAQLNGAWLNGAQLNGAWLNGAQLNRAWLNGAQLNGAQLDDAQLNRAQLDDAQLYGTQLNDAIGNKKEIKSMQLSTYNIVFTDTILAIGCEQHLITEWRNFSDERIKSMDCDALEFWLKWREFIFKAIQLSNEDE